MRKNIQTIHKKEKQGLMNPLSKMTLELVRVFNLCRDIRKNIRTKQKEKDGLMKMLRLNMLYS